MTEQSADLIRRLGLGSSIAAIQQCSSEPEWATDRKPGLFRRPPSCKVDVHSLLAKRHHPAWSGQWHLHRRHLRHDLPATVPQTVGCDELPY